MGRKPLGLKAALIRLDESHFDRIEALRGPRRVSEYAREAVEEKLLRDERKAKRKGMGDADPA